MTNVRLTATNPEDSSVVPVACNSRGELLVVEPVIERIPNNVTIEGNLTALRGTFTTDAGDGSLQLSPTESNSIRQLIDGELEWWIDKNAYAEFRKSSGGERLGDCVIAQARYGFTLKSPEGTHLWGVEYDGSTRGARFIAHVDAGKPEAYQLVQRDGVEELSYIGETMDLVEEVQFLRTQLRQTMEKLKMAPEGGWEVWDGSS